MRHCFVKADFKSNESTSSQILRDDHPDRIGSQLAEIIGEIDYDYKKIDRYLATHDESTDLDR